MKLERTKNASRNILFGLILKIYQIVVPFLMRTAMIYFMGVEYLGLNSLFASVLQVLNLAELGVGVAMVFNMYKPIAEDNTKKICALMHLYKIYYRVIGIIILVLGLALLPFIPYLVKGDLPEGLNIYVLYLINLGATVLTYWLFAYKNSLLNAHQRNDVTSKISLITNTVQYLLQLAVLIFLKDYYIYCIVLLSAQIANNLITAAIVTKMYPNYHADGKLEKAEIKVINQRIKDLFTAKLGAVVVNSADTVIISAFLGLTILAEYQNYYFIMTAVIGVVAIVFSSCTAGIGNSLIVETKEKNYNDFQKFTFITAWIASFCTACFLCLFQPFMKIWVGEELMLDISVVVLLCIYYYIYEVNCVLNLYKDAAGMWHEDRFRPLVTALANLVLNLVSVLFLGLYGVILSTVISTLFVGMPWLLKNIFTVIFEKNKMRSYVINLIKYTAVTIISSAMSFFVCTFYSFGLWYDLLLSILTCIVIPNLAFVFAFRKKKEYKEAVILMDKMTKGKLKLSKLLLKK